MTRWRRASALGTLFDAADDLDDRDRIRAQLRGELILNRLRYRDETGLVDVLDDLDADALQLLRRLLLELERVRRLLLADLGGGLLDALPSGRRTRLCQVLSLTHSRLLLASCWVNDITGATS